MPTTPPKTDSERPIKQASLKASSYLLFLLLSVSCTASTDRQDWSDSTLTVHLIGKDEWLFGPAQADEAMFLMFLPLVQQGPNGGIEGRLAQSWEHSIDYRTWTIYLRTDVRWHDGVPVTAHDVAFTAWLLTHPDVARLPADAFQVTVLNDSTYTVDILTRDERGAVTPGRAPTLTGIYFPKHLLEELDPSEFFEWDFWLQPVGNGPYRYARHVPQTMVELEANPDFYLGEPEIERVVLRFGGDNQLLELQSEAADVALYAEWTDLVKLADDSRFEFYWTKDNWVFMGIQWNVGREPLADPLVRRALTMAIDRQALHRNLSLPDETPLFEGVFTERQYWAEEFPEPIPFDPTEAARLLDQAGWRLGADGFRTRDGATLVFEGLVMGEDQINETAAIYVQDQLRDVGVLMELVPLESLVLRERWSNGDFDAILGDVLTAPTWLDRMFGSGAILGYTNPQVTELIGRAARSLDPDETDELYAELGAILSADLPMTALFPDYEMHVVHRRVRGLSSPFRAVPLRHVEELWLEGAP
jgi:peptide/nickel transport system substrate-binding protein